MFIGMEIQGENNTVEESLKAIIGGSASQVGFDERVQEMIRRGSLNFTTWTALISKIEKLFPDNLEAICSVYDSFLLEFPLCHEYWEKYVAHKAHLCTIDKLVDIYERAVKSASYCVSIWVEYCSFGILAFEDPFDVRRLFKRAISFVGKDYMCHPLWDKYFEFEFSQQQWSFLAQIYVQALRFPTKKLHSYYDNFKKFVDILEEEMKEHFDGKDIEMESMLDTAVITSKDEISSLFDNLLHPSTSTGYFRKYISIGERYYRDASELEKKIYCFETNIRRHYFDGTPVDEDEFENWRRYLDLVENQEDFDWAVKLYERCLIPCSGYPEFWMRYVEYTETKGGRELGKSALDRATKIFLKNSPEIHFFNAQFKELIGDKTAPSTTLVWSDCESNSHFVEKVVREANRDKRLGNFEAACAVYNKALEMAAERQKLHAVSILYIHFARFVYLMTGKRDQARDVIIKGLKHLPYCKILLEGLINLLMTHGYEEKIDLVDNLVADAISPRFDGSQGLSDEDRQDISILFLQFVDLCGTIHDIRKVWSRHIKLFTNLIRPSFSDKLHTSDNQLRVIEEQILSFPENHALQTEGLINTTNHAQPENDTNITKENFSELYPESTKLPVEDTSQGDHTTPNSVNKPTQDLVCEVAENGEKGQKCLSLVGLSLNNQEMECGEIASPGNCSNVNIIPSIAQQGSSQEAVSDQIQNKQLNQSSLANHENVVPEQADLDAHLPKAQGGTQGYSTATHTQEHNQTQPSTMPAFHAQTQMPQYQMQSGGEFGYNQQYNQMAGYYYQQQQIMLQQQQYMQQVQQQPNMLQSHDQHMLYVQQQQQLAQMYYQQPQQTHAQQALMYQQFYQGQQVMTQYDPSSSVIVEPPQPAKQSP